MRATLVPALAAPPPARRILLIRLGALGDVVRTRIAFAGVRALYPEARIDWLVEDRAAGGLEGIVGLDRIVMVPRRSLRAGHPLASLGGLSALSSRLRGERYDLCLDFHSLLKSALLARASAAPLRVGFSPPLGREGSHRFYTHRVRIERSHLSRFERNAALVRALGGEVPQAPPPLALSPEDLGVGEELPERFVALHPGTSAGTPYKRWPIDRFGALAREIRARTGFPSVITWGPGERETALRVASVAGEGARLAPETPRIGALLGLYRRAALFVGSDSGPAHLAGLVGCPLVILFGPTDPVENAPMPGVPFRGLRVDVGCNPCREGCPPRACMLALGCGGALEAALELLGEADPRAFAG